MSTKDSLQYNIKQFVSYIFYYKGDQGIRFCLLFFQLGLKKELNLKAKGKQCPVFSSTERPENETTMTLEIVANVYHCLFFGVKGVKKRGVNYRTNFKCIIDSRQVFILLLLGPTIYLQVLTNALKQVKIVWCV